MQTGMTLKQMAIDKFLRGVQAYKDAVKNNNPREVIYASLAIQSSKGDIPRKYLKLASRKALTST